MIQSGLVNDSVQRTEKYLLLGGTQALVPTLSFLSKMGMPFYVDFSERPKDISNNLVFKS